MAGIVLILRDLNSPSQVQFVCLGRMIDARVLGAGNFALGGLNQPRSLLIGGHSDHWPVNFH